MKVKLNWLKELVDLEGLTANDIVEKLSLYSIEVESVYNVVSGTNLVVGHVLDCVPHPDSDHLSVCQVNVGNEVLQIVCGAPNIKKDLNVIVATNGAVLPGDFKIKKSKIRGIESNGMICSLQEIGLDKKYVLPEYQNGIYYFKENVTIGSNALEALNLEDVVIELGLTPNRGDLLSMIGVAYEVSAILNRPLKKLSQEFIAVKELTSNNIEVKNQTEDCILYSAAIIKNVEIKPSPSWLISRLIAFGIRPINNVVDITNYILALFGQPLHAFDYDKLGNKILIRNAHESEEIITLDEQKRVLKSSDIVITDGVKPVVIAGVMGGAETEVTEDTKNLVIEAAVFKGDVVRKTSTRIGLRSESSIRFEKGVDVNRTLQALEYACYLLNKYANGDVLKGFVTSGITKIDDEVLTLNEEDVINYLGIKISLDEIKNIFERLNFKTNISNDSLQILVPNRRNEIKIKADLIEEVARIYGYENLPENLPRLNLMGSLTNKQKVRRAIKNNLSTMGLNETVNYSLVSEEVNNLFTYNHHPNGENINLLMPLSNERKTLRKSLIPGLVENAIYNQSRKIKDLALFEVGKVYYNLNGENKEEEVLAILMANNFTNTLWKGQVEKVDYYLIKGILDQLSNELNINLEYRLPETYINEMHPKRTAMIYYKNKQIGYIGELHPKYAQSKDLKDIYVLEVKIDDMLNQERAVTKFTPISKTPDMQRDIAVVVSRDVLASELVETIKATDKKLLSKVEIFDVYTGENVEKNEKSIALSLTFSSNETLTDDIVNNRVNKIIKELEKKFNAKLRG